MVGIPSPPPSPNAAPIGGSGHRRPGLPARVRSGDAAHHITEECERLFCETLQTVFLVEKDTGLENSLVMDAQEREESRNDDNTRSDDGGHGMAIPQQTLLKHALPTPSPSPTDAMLFAKPCGLVKDLIEVFDYAGGLQFRGFVAEKDDERALFVFFDQSIIGADMKPG